MKAKEIRQKYINYFKSKNHNQIDGSKLVPQDDASVLFTTAGMQQLIPYLMGQDCPYGTRLVDFQECLRTNDIEEVGDNRHLTFFEMLGNWSIGDYFKEESVKMSFEFLTKHLNIPIEKLYVTCFEGDETTPKDEVTAKVWEECGIPKDHIFFKGKSDNWWIAGDTGPCGPDTEIFYDTGKPKCSNICDPSCDCGKYVEIWNNVFMQYNQKEDGTLENLKQTNVDTGMGLERITMIMQEKQTPFDTELFSPMMEKLEKDQKEDLIESRRIVAEHLRASTMLIASGVIPSNVDRGYILRRLIRRALRHFSKLGISFDNLDEYLDLQIQILSDMYEEVKPNEEKIKSVFIGEKNKFEKTLIKGQREFEKEVNKLKQNNITKIPDEIAFKLYDTYGYPIEMTKELATENGMQIDIDGFEKMFKKHQEISKMGQEKKFKGGLGSTTDMTIKYHTATHLLHAALKKVLGSHVNQAGSNITDERLRFDFTHPQKMTKEEIKQVEDLVNEQIKRNLQVTCETMTLDEAKNSGAIGLFENKYENEVLVYTIGDFSKEICGGPHVSSTGSMGTFKIKKEESSSAGIRRIKAVLID